MADKILCPWCGAEMHHCGIKRVYDWEGHEMCGKCGATSPKRWAISQDAVRAQSKTAALRRYTPPIKPMTFEEVERIVRSDNIDDETPLYLEDVYGHNCWEISYKMTYMCRALKDEYGKTWRCWSRKPTDEERSAAEWET